MRKDATYAITVRFPAHMESMLKEAAQSDSRSVNSFIVVTLAQYFANKKKVNKDE